MLAGSKQFVNNPNSHIAPAPSACQLLLFFIGKSRSGKMKCRKECSWQCSIFSLPPMQPAACALLSNAFATYNTHSSTLNPLLPTSASAWLNLRGNWPLFWATENKLKRASIHTHTAHNTRIQGAIGQLTIKNRYIPLPPTNKQCLGQLSAIGQNACVSSWLANFWLRFQFFGTLEDTGLQGFWPWFFTIIFRPR